MSGYVGGFVSSDPHAMWCRVEWRCPPPGDVEAPCCCALAVGHDSSHRCECGRTVTRAEVDR